MKNSNFFLKPVFIAFLFALIIPSVIKAEIQELAQQRDEYLKKQVEERGGAKDSLDAKVYGAVREQAAAVGLSYEADAPVY